MIMKELKSHLSHVNLGPFFAKNNKIFSITHGLCFLLSIYVSMFYARSLQVYIIH